MTVLLWKLAVTDYRSPHYIMANRKRLSKKSPATAQGSVQPSTSDTKHEQLIKELTQSKLFHEYLAEMIIHCITSIQNKIDDMEEELTAMNESISKNKQSISDLLSCIDELNQSPVQSPEANNQNDTDLLLRIHGINASPADFCEKLCQIVSTRLHIPCTPELFSTSEMHTPPEISATRAASPIHHTSQVTVKIASPTLRNDIYRARTLLKGTSIYISEVLSKSNQYLFYLARSIKKVQKIASTWTYKGQVYIRSLDNIIKTINCPSELADL